MAGGGGSGYRAEPRQSARSIVPFTIPPALGRVRRHWDYAASVGIGPHVTDPVPLRTVRRARPGGPRTELAAIARTVTALEVRFERVRRLPHLVWVEPEPAEPFAALTAAVVDRWPTHPPYGGAHATVIPHLTVVESPTAPLEEIEDLARRSRPSRGRPSGSRRGARTAPVGGAPAGGCRFGVRP